MFICQVVCVGLLALLAAADPAVYKITTYPDVDNAKLKSGSILGGTRLRIRGREFDTTDPKGSNLILVGDQPCEIVEFYTSGEYLECLTPPPVGTDFPSTVPISVWVANTEVTIDPTAYPSFTYSWSNTPIVHHITPFQAPPGYPIAFYGKWLTDNLDYMSEFKVAGKGMVKDDLNIAVDYTSYGYFNVTGYLGANTAGDSEVHSRIDGNAGLAYFKWTASSYDLEGNEYKFKTIPLVKSISAHSGSPEGGHLLKIIGAGYPLNAEQVSVFIGENECIVKSVEYDTITCETAKVTSEPAEPYIGGAGLRRQMWTDQTEGINDIENLIGTTEHLYTDDIVPVPDIPSDSGVEIRTRMWGYFIPPRTGEYTFYISSDDSAKVFLSTDATRDKKQEIINFSGWTDYRDMFGKSNLNSDPISLTAGSYYFLEIWHTQGYGAVHFNLGVEVPGEDETPSANPLPKILKLNIGPTTTIKREKQVIKIPEDKTGQLRVRYGDKFTEFIDGAITTGTSPYYLWDCTTINTKMTSASFPNIVCSFSKNPDTGDKEYTFTFNYAWSDIRNDVWIYIKLPSGSILTYTPSSDMKVSPTYPIKGTFTLNINGVSTSAISIGASANSVRDAIVVAAPSLIEVMIIDGSSGGDGGSYRMMIPGNMVLTITLDATLLTGGGVLETDLPTASINSDSSKEQNQFYWVVPSEFLATVEEGPQVVVRGNGLRAMCSGDCSYSYLPSESLPTITSFNNDGSVLTFQGTDLPTEGLNIAVGHADCVIVSSTSDTLTCTKPQSEAGDHIPIIKSSSIGTIPYSSTLTPTPSITYPLTITSASPSEGSQDGGLILTISGTGFPPYITDDITLSVSIGNSPCSILDSIATQITCITGPSNGGNTVSITVGDTSQTSDTVFSYTSAATPTISTYTPQEASTYSTTTITIDGSGFLTDKTQLKVTIGEEECLIVTCIESQIVCKLLGGPKGVFTFSIYVEGKGIVIVTESFPLKYEITEVSPTIGSILGNTLLTVKGSGFSSILSQNLVLIGNSDAICLIEEVIDSNTLTCRTPSMSNALASEDAMLDVYMLGRISEESDNCAECQFQYSDTVTPKVSGIAPIRGVEGDTVTITGTGFGDSVNGVNVKLGSECSVVSVTDTTIVVTLPRYKAGPVNLEVVIDSIGQADTTGIVFRYSIAMDSLSPVLGSQGGNRVNIIGNGLGDECIVKFGDVVCSIVSATTTEIECVTEGFTTSEAPQLLGIDCGDESYDCADSSVCGLAFMSSLTPIITGASYNSGSDSVTITGSGFISDTSPSMNIITIGDAPCTVTSATTTQLVCTPLGLPTTQPLKLYIKDKGFASGTFNLNIPMKINTVSTTFGSFAGGNSITLIGKGLGPDTTITICGQTCTMSSAQYDSYICEVSALATIYSQENYEITPEDSMLMDVTYISSAVSSGYPVSNIHDNKLDTYFKSSVSDECYVGIDAGSGWKIQLYSFMIMPYINSLQKYKDLQGGKLQGSDDNTTWIDLYTIQGAFEGMNSWTVPQDRIEGDNYPVLRYRYYRYLGKGNCYIAELHFKGAKLLNSDSQTQECEIRAIYSKGNSASNIAADITYSYDSIKTPKLTGISPKFGTTAGGFDITFTVEDVSLDSTKLSIKVDNVECTNISVTGTTVTCTAGPRSEYVTPSLVITHSDIGNVATQGLTFLYAERWSDENTWGGTIPPREGETVHIPKGQTLVIDQETPILNLITVEGILMIEDKAYNGPVLQAHYIMIKGGQFIVGTEEEPFQNNCEIILHGRREDPEIPIYGNKVIAVRNGILDLHGVERTPTWTMLETTADVGSTEITVQEDVDWTTGDVIVIASTSFEYKEAEVRTIVRVSDKTITLDQPLVYQHYAATETYGDDIIDMRAEVGLLTRNIRIHGVEEYPEEEHGVHIMLTSPGDESCIGRIENVEIYNAGQAYSLGRYPIHFHMIGKVMKSYIRNNSIHHTHNRACTIHGVHYLRVINNVAFHNKGHAFFVEDGIETKNIIMHNLGLYTLQSWSLLNSDQSPATFWITNFDNTIIGNHAAGGDRYGFWFDPPSHPSGPSSTPLICPKGDKLGQFEGNSAHSYVKYGFRIFHGHIPRERPCDDLKDDSLEDPWSFNPTVKAVYKDFTGWKNKMNGAISEQLGDVTLEGFKVADNLLAGIEVSYVGFSKPYLTTRIENALIIGKSANSENNVAGSIGLITPQRDGMVSNNIRFYNFDDDMYPIGDESHSFSVSVIDVGARVHRFSQLQFTNSHRRIHWEIPKRGTLEFTDDTMTGVAGSFLGAYWPHLLTPECEHKPIEFNSIVCNSSKKIRRVLFHAQVPFSLFNFKNLYTYRLTGDEIPTETVTDQTGSSVEQVVVSTIPMIKACRNTTPLKTWAVPYVTGYKYKVFWGETPLDWEGFLSEFNMFEPGEMVVLQFNHTDVREFYEIKRGTVPKGVDTTAPDYINPTVLPHIIDREFTPEDIGGSYRWDNATKWFEIGYTGIAANIAQKGDIRVTAYRCYGDHCSNIKPVDENPVEVTTKRWSDPKSWPSQVLPVDGDNITITSDTDMILDMDSPILNILEIQGKVTFDPSKDASLHAKIIFNRKGTISSGNSTHPVNPEVTHEIILHGDPTDDSYVFDPSIEAGNKVLINTGEMKLYGAPKIPWVRLAMNAYPGDEWIFVEEVDWSVGDEIVIGSSSFDMAETESFSITEIVGGIPPYSDASNGRRLEQHSSYDFSTDESWQVKYEIRDTGKVNNQSYKLDIVTPASTNLTKLKLSSPIQYYHIGIKNKVQSNEIDMRAEVGVLTRNIKIRGDGNSWKCNILVAEYLDFATTSGNPVTRTGFVNFDNIEIKDCGQNDLDRTSLRFQNTGTSPSSVTNSVIRNSDTYALIVKDASNIVFSNNLVHYTKRLGIVVISTDGLTLTNNLVVEVKSRGISMALDLQAVYWLCETTCRNLIVRNNVASGYNLFGFLLPGIACRGDSNLIEDNVAHSGASGFMFRDTGYTCMKASKMTAYMNTDTAIVNFAGAEKFTLSDLKLAENQIALSIMGWLEDSSFSFTLNKALIVGQTVHTKCEESPSNCANLPECQRRLGIVANSVVPGTGATSLTSKIKLPLLTVKKPTQSIGIQSYSDITLANFVTADYCGVSHAIGSSNIRAPDYILPQFFSKVNLNSVGENSKVYMPDPNPEWAIEDDCGNWPCTGPLNVVIKDRDGSLVGNTMGGYLLPNNPGVARGGYCNFNQIMNAFVCKKSASYTFDYANLIFESKDEDTYNRTISPVYVQSYDNILQANNKPFYNKLNSFMDHDWDGFYTSHHRLSRFPTIIELGRFYNITFTSTLPSRMLYQLQGTDDSNQAIVVTVDYVRPSAVQVYMNGTYVKPLNYFEGDINHCTLDHSSGTNKWFYDMRKIQFVIRGYDVIELVVSNSIQMTARFDMSIKEFFADNGVTNFIDRLAAALRIPSYRIRVVEVKQGSVIVVTEITNDPSLVGKAGTQTGKAADLEELERLRDTVLEKAQGGSLDLGYPLLDIETKVITVDTDADNDGDTDADNDGDIDNDSDSDSDSDSNHDGDTDSDSDNDGDSDGGLQVERDRRDRNKLKISNWYFLLLIAVVGVSIFLIPAIIYMCRRRNSHANILPQEIIFTNTSPKNENSNETFKSEYLHSPKTIPPSDRPFDGSDQLSNSNKTLIEYSESVRVTQKRRTITITQDI